MHHHKRRAEARREVDGLEREPEGALAIQPAVRGKLVAVRRGVCDFNRQRTEVVKAGKDDPSPVEILLDAFHQRQTDAVSEFDARESQIQYFLQHWTSVGVAVRVPA